MNSYAWGMDVDLCSLQGVRALLELRPNCLEVWSNYNFGVDVNKCMTKAFADTILGLLYRLEMDNCHFHYKIGFAKELFNISGSTEHFALPSGEFQPSRPSVELLYAQARHANSTTSLL